MRAFARRRPLVVLLALALLLRVFAVTSTLDYAPTGDPSDYDRHARVLADFGVFAGSQLTADPSPSAYRPPAYPVLLAGIYAVAGVAWDVARMVGALLGTLAVLLLYLLVLRLFDRRLALWAAGVAAVSPLLVWLNASLLSETLLTPLIAGFALCVAAYRDRPRLVLAAAAGLLVGLAALTRTNALALCLPLVLGLFTGPRRLAGPALALACVALTMAPWAVRNAAVFDRFLPLGTQGGFTMAAQWNRDATQPGFFRAVSRDLGTVRDYADVLARRGLDEAELDAALRKEATAFAREHPDHVGRAFAYDLARMFDLGPGRSNVTMVTFREMAIPEFQRSGVRMLSYLLVLVTIAGLVVLRRRRRGPLWLWLIPLLVIVTVAPFTGKPRYRAPADLFLAIPAAAALVAWRDRPRRREGRRAGVEAV